MPVNQTTKAELFRALHAGSKTFVMPNPWDIGTARVLAGLGFTALATTSAGLAFTLGKSDGEVSRAEAIEHARVIAGATDLPVSGDLENGYGHGADVVAETIRMAAGAGLVGCSIEDASGDPDRPIYDHDHAVERIEAAAAAARALPFPFMLTARAENFLHGRRDLDDTIRRLVAFEAAGADVLYAPGLHDPAQIRAVCAAVTRPVNVLAGIGPNPLSVAEIAACGARRISLGSWLERAATGAFVRAAQELAGPGTMGFTADAVSFAEADRLMAAGGEGSA